MFLPLVFLLLPTFGILAALVLVLMLLLRLGFVLSYRFSARAT
jgi:hypothetical protein